MTQTRKELLEAQLVDNSYTRTFDFNAEAETGFVESVGLGLAGAVVSGGVGMLNTGIAVGNMFGADIDQLKTEELLESWDWDDTREFYMENKEVVDAVGFGLSALVPGAAGLRAAKYVQSAKWVNNSQNLAAVGLRKVVLPTNNVEKFADLVKKDTMHIANRALVNRKAAAQGFHQAAVETAFAETAILLSTNQHTTVNSEQLGYFDAMWEQKEGAMFGFGLGVGIGGVVAAARHRKVILNLGKTSDTGTNKLMEQSANLDSKTGRLEFNQGNRIVEMVQRRDHSRNAAKDLTGAEAVNAQRRMEEFDRTLVLEIGRLTGEHTVTKGKEVVTGHFTSSIMKLIGQGKVEEVADMFHDANAFVKFNDVDALFDPKMHPMTISKTTEEYRDAIGSSMYGTDTWIKAINAPNPTAAQKRMIADSTATARSSGGVSIGTAYDKIRENFLNMELNEQVGKQWLDDFDPEHIIGTIRHELGHSHVNHLGVMFKNEEFARRYTSEIIELSRLRRPGAWEQLDTMMKDRTYLTAQQAKRNLTVAERRRLVDITQHETYMNQPNELLADAWAMFNSMDPKLRKLSDRVGANTRVLFQDNDALKLRLGKTEKYLGLKSGKLYDEAQWAPTVADRGTPTLRKGVVFSGDMDSVKIDTEGKFSILKATPDEASAHYWMAVERPHIRTKEVNVNWDNFYELNRLQNGLKSEKWKGTLNLKLEDGTIKVMDFSNPNNSTLKSFNEQYRELKAVAAQKLNQQQAQKGRSLTPNDIGRVIDTDEDFAMNVGVGKTVDPFWSQTNPVDKPTVGKIKYQTAIDEDRTGALALAEAAAADYAVIDSANNTVTSFFHTVSNLNGEGLTKMDLNAIAPAPSYLTKGFGNTTEVTTSGQATGFLQTGHGEYGEFSSTAQAIASLNSSVKLKGKEYFQTQLANNIQRINSSGADIMELNVLDSKLRQHFYYFTPQLDSPESVSRYLLGLATEVPPEIAQKNLGRFMQSTEGQAIVANMRKSQQLWTRDTSQLIDKMMNQSRFKDTIIRDIHTNFENSIQVQSNEVYKFWQNSVKANGLVVEGKKAVSSARGLGSTLDENVLYPGTIDNRKYKHVAYVIPKKNGVWGTTKKGIVGANTPQELAEKQSQVREAFGDDVMIRTKEDMEEYFQLNGKYEDEFDLNEYQANSDLARKGLLWDVAPEANKDLAEHYLNGMARQWEGVADNLTKLKYTEEFASLEQMDGVAQRFASTGRGTTKSIDSPAQEMQRIMLNRSKSEHPSAWTDAQSNIDKTISVAWNTMTSMFTSSAKSGNYEDMVQVMEHYGLPKVYGELEGKMLRTSLNLTEEQAARIVPKLNGIAGTLMLRLDGIQPLVNALSMPIMSVPEMDVLMKSIPKIQAQQLAKGLHTVVPGTKYSMGTNLKLQMQAVKEFFGEEGKALLKDYYEQGIISNVLRETRQVVDGVAIDANMTASSMFAKVENAAQRTVNILATPVDKMEDFVKFVAARQADLLLDAAGITDKSIRRATLRTYTTRVHGNYVAAQRPKIFQGFAGQALGLFQTYQFNLIQSLLGKIGDKNSTAVSAMMGLQAGIFGAQSVPGFKAMNDYVAMGSQDGNDFYTGAQTLLGDEESEWALFGVASNFTKPLFHAGNYLLGTDAEAKGLDLYVRGDLNPRTPFIIPTSPSEVPIWTMSTKFLKNILNAGTDLSRGVDAGQVFADTLAHNGVNRPLAGIGAILASSGIPGMGNSVRTTSKGTLVANLSDLDWFSKVARVAGTKTLDESMAVQAFYRTKAYDTKRQDQLQDLGRSAKRMIQSGQYDADLYNGFLENYTAKGGRAEHFNKWMHSQALGATESTIMNLYKSHGSHSGKYLQNLMGNDVGNFINPTLNPADTAEAPSSDFDTSF